MGKQDKPPRTVCPPPMQQRVCCQTTKKTAQFDLNHDKNCHNFIFIYLKQVKLAQELTPTPATVATKGMKPNKKENTYFDLNYDYNCYNFINKWNEHKK